MKLLEEVKQELRVKTMKDTILFITRNSNPMRVHEGHGETTLLETNYINLFNYLEILHGTETTVSMLMDFYLNQVHVMVMNNPHVMEQILKQAAEREES